MQAHYWSNSAFIIVLKLNSKTSVTCCSDDTM